MEEEQVFSGLSKPPGTFRKSFLELIWLYQQFALMKDLTPSRTQEEVGYPKTRQSG